MRINQNISALNAYRNLVMNDNRLNKSLERLSSGLRINRAADDAAGLAISEKMRGQIRGLNQAMRNAQDGISLIQTAEGALNETHSILQRMRELSVQAANDTLTASDRVEIQKEINQLKDEIDRIANTTEFNTKKLLDGTTSALSSTDNLKTKVFMRDGLRTIDQFGQKAVGGGNYKLEIEANPGLGQVQKTDIMKVKHGVMNEAVDEHLGHALWEGILSGSTTGVNTFTFNVDGTSYTVTAGGSADASAAVTAFALAINNTAGLNDAITAVSDSANDTLTITRTDQPGEDFRFGWELANAGAFDGVAQKSLHTISPADTNVQGMDVDANSMLVGEYEFLTDDNTGSTGSGTVKYFTSTAGSISAGATITFSPGSTFNQSMIFEVKEVNISSAGSTSGTITFNYSYHQIDVDGNVTSGSGERTLNVGSGTSNTNITFGNVSFSAFNLTDDIGNFAAGDKILTEYKATSVTGSDTVQLDKLTASTGSTTWDFNTGVLNNTTTTFNFYQLDTNSASSTYGQVKDASIDLTFGILRDASDSTNPAAGFEIKTGALGQIARSDTSIYDIDRFWDASGNFLVEDPQTIQLVQGDGSTTSFTIFGTDTIGDVQDKLNNAIHEGLEQKEVNAGSSDAYVWYSHNATDTSGHFTVSGTFVIQSAVTGKDGEITFIGDESVINALSLTTIQQSSESIYTVNVTDAHTGDVVAEDVSVSGNTLVGTVHENVDVKFDPLAGIDFAIEDGQFGWSSADEAHTTYVHLADNTMVFHIGANSLQDVGASIGNMGSSALGVDNILVTNQSAANRAITQLDGAIGRVSSERSKLGAVQNRLEHTINNLGVAAENLTAAESRIRDLDFALEMVEFTRNQIMQQASTAMLAQANMKPQNVLMLLG